MYKYLLLIIFPISLIAQTATPPSSGDGSSGDPYQIDTLNNLYWITQNSDEWSAYYIQTANINASSSSSWDSNAGYKSVIWNATNNQGQPISAGVYLYSIEAANFRQTKKMVLLK